jgi:uncharacterized membrane protein
VRERIQRGLLALLIGLGFLFAAIFSIRVADTRRMGWSALPDSVAGLDAWNPPPGTRAILGAIILGIAILLLRRQTLLRSSTAVFALALAVAPIAIAAASPFGYFASLLAAAILLALLIGLEFPKPRVAERSKADLRIAIALWAVAAAVHSLFAMHRLWAFGGGSWDLGCMIHNFYRASRFLDSTSTVLGDVDYLGDHFMIGIYLYAPIYWISSSGYCLLLIQALNMGAVGPAIYLIARERGAQRGPAIALALAAAFAFGIQSAMFFDSHEIAVGFGFLAFGLWAFETKRWTLATLLLAAFMLFKESLGAYVAAIGMLAVWRGVRDADRTSLRRGLAWIAMGAVWFVLVNRLFMPALIARANPPEPHETFADFGPTVFQAGLGMLAHPLKALGALFVPSQEKVQSQLVTLLGTGGLALASPEVLIAALPLLAERFLSSKNTMWEMGYHYAAPLSLYAAWAAAAGWPKISRAASKALEALGPGTGELAGGVLAIYLLASTALINSVGYRHPANYHTWNLDYFSSPERRAANARAVELLKGEGAQARLAVQNRILPALANRPVIYRLGDWQKADLVLLSIGENAWPWDDGFPARLAAQLENSHDWRLRFQEKGTQIYERVRGARTSSSTVDPDRGDR